METHPPRSEPKKPSSVSFFETQFATDGDLSNLYLTRDLKPGAAGSPGIAEFVRGQMVRQHVFTKMSGVIQFGSCYSITCPVSRAPLGGRGTSEPVGKR